jgi:hypothetical protein
MATLWEEQTHLDGLHLSVTENADRSGLAMRLEHHIGDAPTGSVSLAGSDALIGRLGRARIS